jgi:hypothetical protein
MKNIHVLPTNKPSRLFTWGNKLRLGDFVGCPGYLGKLNKNIYITSDEEIKGDTVAINLRFNCVQKVNPPKDVDYIFNKCFKKIILTTDQDLIKDGVQAIDDEFLEWFVKNPGCEFVETPSFCRNGDDCLSMGSFDKQHLCDIKYTIIIPKEEPKQDEIMERFIANAKQEETLEEHYLSIPKPLIDVSRMKVDNHPDIDNKETLEKACDRLPIELDYSEFDETSFKLGAKWQVERMYSEEDLKKSV